MRQNEWLGPLSETPEYKAFLDSDIQYRNVDEKDPAQTPICSVREGTWGGKKKTKCFISKTAIQPGDAITRIRRMRGCHGFDDFDIASKAGIAGSGWQAALREFETNTVPLRRLLGPPGHTIPNGTIRRSARFTTIPCSILKLSTSRALSPSSLRTTRRRSAAHGPKVLNARIDTTTPSIGGPATRGMASR